MTSPTHLRSTLVAALLLTTRKTVFVLQIFRQRKSNRFCDVTIVVNETNFTAHQCVLVASCEYFEEIFDEQVCLQ